jgi:hypothetical protein
VLTEEGTWHSTTSSEFTPFNMTLKSLSILPKKILHVFTVSPIWPTWFRLHNQVTTQEKNNKSKSQPFITLLRLPWYVPIFPGFIRTKLWFTIPSQVSFSSSQMKKFNNAAKYQWTKMD